MGKKSAIRLFPHGRFFLGWHKFYNRQGCRAMFHPADMRVFFDGLDDEDLLRTCEVLKERGHMVEVVEVVYVDTIHNFAEARGIDPLETVEV